MAVTLTLTFCYKNKRWIIVAPEKLYELSKLVAESSPSKKQETINKLNKIFNKIVVKTQLD